MCVCVCVYHLCKLYILREYKPPLVAGMNWPP